MIKSILFLSYYYPPYTGIEGNRIYSWSKSLSDSGFQVTVVTRHWQAGGQHEWKDYFSEYEIEREEERVNDNLSIVRVPYNWSKAFRNLNESKIPSVLYWYNKAIGNFHIETDASNSLYNEALKQLNEKEYDFIIVSSPPLNIVKLGVQLKQEFNVPLLIDFRDSFNNHLLNPKYEPTIKSRFEMFLFKKYLKRWISNADVVTSVSEAVFNTLPISKSQRKIIVMNGYEEDAINKQVVCNNGSFNVSLIGSLYPEQDIEFMAEGFAAFIDKVQPEDFKIQFIGIKSRKEVRGRIEKIIGKKYLLFTDRVPRKEALQYMNSSSLLLQIGWRGYKGYCPGKVFEYLVSKRNILIAPGDGDLTDRIIRETETGVSVSSQNEMVDYLEKVYKQWKGNGCVAYNGIEEEVEKYSRKNQNSRVIKYFKSIK